MYFRYSVHCLSLFHFDKPFVKLDSIQPTGIPSPNSSSTIQVSKRKSYWFVLCVVSTQIPLLENFIIMSRCECQVWNRSVLDYQCFLFDLYLERLKTVIGLYSNASSSPTHALTLVRSLFYFSMPLILYCRFMFCMFIRVTSCSRVTAVKILLRILSIIFSILTPPCNWAGIACLIFSGILRWIWLS